MDDLVQITPSEMDYLETERARPASSSDHLDVVAVLGQAQHEGRRQGLGAQWARHPWKGCNAGSDVEVASKGNVRESATHHCHPL